MKKLWIRTSLVLCSLMAIAVLFAPAVNNIAANALLGDIVETTPSLIANDDSATTDEDIPVTIDVMANDNLSGTGLFFVSSVTQPSNGVAKINSDNTITYTPNQDFFGSDSFQYTASDSAGLLQDSATVFIIINSVNDPPVANDDFVTTNKNTSVSFFAEENDFDVDGDEIFVISVTQGTNSVTEISSNGAITYTPNQNFTGNDPFTYTLSDGNGGVDTAIVAVTVSDSTSAPPSTNGTSLIKTSSGLVAADILTDKTRTFEELMQDQTDLWNFGGSAVTFSAPHTASQDGNGLHIGTKSHSSGQFAGFFAVTTPRGAQLNHAEITANQQSIPNNFFMTGLFVQSAATDLNFVTCIANTGTAGTTWHLARTTGGTPTQSTGVEVLWSDPAPNQPLTRDCTIVTNGDNILKLFMDGVKVYDNSTLNLNMESPFHVFLETQTSNSDNMFFGSFADYYATTNEFLTVTNLPNTASKVQLIDASNNVIAETGFISGGTATMEIATLNFPVFANIKVVDSGGSEIASTTNLQDIYGGDIFSTSQ